MRQKEKSRNFFVLHSIRQKEKIVVVLSLIFKHYLDFFKKFFISVKTCIPFLFLWVTHFYSIVEK